VGGQGRAEQNARAANARRDATRRAFPRMGQRLQLVESQKATRALNRMNAAEDTGQQFSRRGIAFQLHQFAVQPVEVLVTFDQELLNEISPGRLARNPIVFSARFFARQVASSDSKRECFSVGRWWAPPNRTKV